MLWKLYAGGLLAFVVAGCSDAASRISPQENAETASIESAQTADEDGSFETAKLHQGAAAQRRAHRTPPRITRFDANHDGMLQASEVPPRLHDWFVAVDANKDNVVTVEEIRAYNRSHPHPHHHRGHHGQKRADQQQPDQPEPPQHASEVTL